MFRVNDGFTLSVKKNSKVIRNTLLMTMAVLTVLSAVYIIYWSLALNDDIVKNYLQGYLAPLVQIFFNDSNLIDNYLTTGFYLFLLNIPCFTLHYLTQKTEEALIFIHRISEANKERVEKIKAEKEIEKEYTIISKYSICLSIDLSENKYLSEDYGKKLNNYVTKLLKKELNKISDKIQVSNTNAILIYGNNFYEYDKIYSTVLKELANVKNLLGNKIKFTPTITTDAYTGEFNPEKAIKQHFEIIKCNLQGRSTATATFRKKYTHISKSKYAGIPIGLYSTFKNNDYKEYDLNLVHKNLNQAIANII